VSREHERLEAAHAYLRARDKPTWRTWEDGYASHRAGELTLPQSLALVHPDWRPQGLASEKLQGKRAFRVSASPTKCQSIIVWGYECDLDQESIHQDHHFPYSLGGPTVPSNRLVLCALHNQAKSGDIHHFAWEKEPSWLDSQLALTARLMAVYR